MTLNAEDLAIRKQEIIAARAKHLAQAEASTRRVQNCDGALELFVLLEKDMAVKAEADQEMLRQAAAEQEARPEPAPAEEVA